MLTKEFNYQNRFTYFTILTIYLVLSIMFLVFDDYSRFIGGLIIVFSLTMAIAFVIAVEKSELMRPHPKFSSLETTLNFTDATLPYFREGLNPTTALEIAQIIKDISNVPAVALTDKENVLAFVGAGCDQHPVGYPIRTQTTLDSIRDGRVRVMNGKDSFNCKQKDCICPLTSMVIVPLHNQNEVIGCLKLYETSRSTVRQEFIRLAVGLGKLITMQLELADADRQRQLTIEAQLDSLQAQVNPHFLFNALNAVSMNIHKDPAFAKQLVLRMSTLFRYLLGRNNRYITIQEEIGYLKDYETIEKARYNNRLNVEYTIDDRCLNLKIPVFIIQPLVHNAVLHGVLPKESEGTIKVSVIRQGDNIAVTVEDDGIGMTEDTLEQIFEPGFGSGCGIGIPNVNDRLRLLYGNEYRLKITSELNEGTIASFKIPIQDEESIEQVSA